MVQYKIGSFVMAISGHDKGKIYMIGKEQERAVYLIDGEKRTLENPKKKNKRHVQLIHNPDCDTIRSRLEEQNIKNNEIIKIIKNFNCKNEQEDVKCQKQM